jgi:hypothetical protein
MGIVPRKDDDYAFFSFLQPKDLEKLKDKPFILFINKLSLGYLYYQFLTAVRKDTRK